MSRFHQWSSARLRVAIALAIGILYASTGKADAAASMEADELFTQGKAALAAQDYGRACPLLAESYRLDPATGSLLALAYCYEADGKLASALDAYRKVITRSQAEGRSDREQAAQERAIALAQQVSTLTVRSEAGPDAPAAQTEPVASSPPGRVVPLVRPLAPRQPQNVDRPLSPLITWTVAGSMTAGIATLCAGSVLALRAVHDNNVANSGCSKNGCVDAPVQKTLRLGAAANLTLAAGGMLTATGIVVLILAKRASTSSKERTSTALISPWATPHGAGATFHGRF